MAEYSKYITLISTTDSTYFYGIIVLPSLYSSCLFSFCLVDSNYRWWPILLTPSCLFPRDMRDRTGLIDMDNVWIGHHDFGPRHQLDRYSQTRKSVPRASCRQGGGMTEKL
jgi:hypothetical protein